jgi:UDP-N-acetylglucosamine transferase subunit ALG13
MPADLPLKTIRKPRILIAPLDWGLGHATRCVPIIRELLVHDCDVWIAGEGAQQILLKEEFPQLIFLELYGYKIKYAKSKAGLLFRMIGQVPKMLDIISYENKWLEKENEVFEFDAVISDNRYGFNNKKLYGIFITHQLSIRTGLGGLFDWLLQKMNYRYIKKFKTCWVPDEENEHTLAGELSHPKQLPKTPVQYLGILSRFQNLSVPEIKSHLLILLSGPEPQRSILENSIVKEIAHYNGSATVVRGLPDSANLIPSTNSIKFFNHLPAEELNKEMQQAEYVIGRSGYSTIMDIAGLNKKSIFIPTPGQAEQEYLAKYLSENNYAFSSQQSAFSLHKALKEASAFTYKSFPQYDNGKLKKIISDLVGMLEIKMNQQV